VAAVARSVKRSRLVAVLAAHLVVVMSFSLARVSIPVRVFRRPLRHEPVGLPQ